MRLRIMITALATLLGCSAPTPLPSVDSVDLTRYQGRWYVWARFDHRFERGCSCSVAEYTVEADRVRVVNYCHEDGSWRTIEGTAFPVAGTNNAQLEVQFFWPFRGDYYVMALDSAYGHVLVGTPSRDYMWMMGRSPNVDETVFNQLSAIAASRGFDTTRLMRTTCASAPALPSPR